MSFVLLWRWLQPRVFRSAIRRARAVLPRNEHPSVRPQQLGRQMEDEENIFDRCMAEVLADEHPSDKHRRLKSLEIIDGVARTAESPTTAIHAARR